jgi:hypothetical protein
MALFLNLYLGHLLGDFLFQPGRLVLAKREGAPGLIVHALVVAVCTFGVVFATVQADWPAVVLVAALHLVIERLTIVTYLRTPTRGLFTLLFDQTLHLLSIAMVVWLSGQWDVGTSAVTFGLRVTLPQLAAFDGLLTVMLFGSILTFETVNAVQAPENGKGRVLRLDVDRLAGMAERGAAFAIAIGVHPVLALAAFLPRLAYTTTRDAAERKRQLVVAATGVVVCVGAIVGYLVVALLSHGVVPTLSISAFDWTVVGP